MRLKSDSGGWRKKVSAEIEGLIEPKSRMKQIHDINSAAPLRTCETTDNDSLKFSTVRDTTATLYGKEAILHKPCKGGLARFEVQGWPRNNPR